MDSYIRASGLVSFRVCGGPRYFPGILALAETPTVATSTLDSSSSPQTEQSTAAYFPFVAHLQRVSQPNVDNARPRPPIETTSFGLSTLLSLLVYP